MDFADTDHRKYDFIVAQLISFQGLIHQQSSPNKASTTTFCRLVSSADGIGKYTKNSGENELS
jgi:hypothetical protein